MKLKVAVSAMGAMSLQAMQQLLKETEASDPKAWALTQHHIQCAKLKRTRLTREIEDLQAAIFEAQMQASKDDGKKAD